MKTIVILFLVLLSSMAWGQEDTLAPVYRFRHHELHFWTIDKKEIKKLNKSGGYWFNEGIAFYAHQSQNISHNNPRARFVPDSLPDSSHTKFMRQYLGEHREVLTLDSLLVWWDDFHVYLHRYPAEVIDMEFDRREAKVNKFMNHLREVMKWERK